MESFFCLLLVLSIDQQSLLKRRLETGAHSTQQLSPVKLIRMHFLFGNRAVVCVLSGSLRGKSAPACVFAPCVCVEVCVSLLRC